MTDRTKGVLAIIASLLVLFSAMLVSCAPAAKPAPIKTPIPATTITPVSPTPTSILTPESIASSTVVPTTSWKTYTNTRFNYSFQYPQEFSLIKGPGGELSDEAFQTVSGISFDGFAKSGDPNSGVVFAIFTDIGDENGHLIQCTDDQECLRKWMLTLGVPPSETSAAKSRIFDQEIIGFQYHADNPLYTQTVMYFMFLRDGRVWLVNLTFNNYSPTETEIVMEIIQRSIATLTFVD